MSTSSRNDFHSPEMVPFELYAHYKHPLEITPFSLFWGVEKNPAQKWDRGLHNANIELTMNIYSPDLMAVSRTIAEGSFTPDAVRCVAVP